MTEAFGDLPFKNAQQLHNNHLLLWYLLCIMYCITLRMIVLRDDAFFKNDLRCKTGIFTFPLVHFAKKNWLAFAHMNNNDDYILSLYTFYTHITYLF